MFPSLFFRRYGAYERMDISIPVEFADMLKELVITSRVYDFSIAGSFLAKMIASDTSASLDESAAFQSGLWAEKILFTVLSGVVDSSNFASLRRLSGSTTSSAGNGRLSRIERERIDHIKLLLLSSLMLLLFLLGIAVLLNFVGPVHLSVKGN